MNTCNLFILGLCFIGSTDMGPSELSNFLIYVTQTILWFFISVEENQRKPYRRRWTVDFRELPSSGRTTISQHAQTTTMWLLQHHPATQSKALWRLQPLCSSIWPPLPMVRKLYWREEPQIFLGISAVRDHVDRMVYWDRVVCIY